MSEKLKKEWAARARKVLVGRKITSCRYMTPAELEATGWDRSPLVIFFDDGHSIYASSDGEGNDAGTLFTTYDDLPGAPVI